MFLHFDKWAAVRQFLVFLSDHNRDTSITEYLFPPSASVQEHMYFLPLRDVTHLQPIRSIVRWHGLVTGSSSWLILFIPEHKSHVCFYLLHGAAWNKLLGAGILPQFPPPEGETIMVSSCYWEIHLLLRSRQFLGYSFFNPSDNGDSIGCPVKSSVLSTARHQRKLVSMKFYSCFNLSRLKCIYRGFMELIFSSLHVNT